jgi:hypothetical protein
MGSCMQQGKHQQRPTTHSVRSDVRPLNTSSGSVMIWLLLSILLRHTQGESGEAAASRGHTVHSDALLDKQAWDTYVCENGHVYVYTCYVLVYKQTYLYLHVHTYKYVCAKNDVCVCGHTYANQKRRSPCSLNGFQLAVITHTLLLRLT